MTPFRPVTPAEAVPPWNAAAAITPSPRYELVVVDPMDKPKGHRWSYFFTAGEPLHLFNVVKANLAGEWHRIKTGDGKEHIIDPDKVRYISKEYVS